MITTDATEIAKHSGGYFIHKNWLLLPIVFFAKFVV
jgi:hypothetical protein